MRDLRRPPLPSRVIQKLKCISSRGTALLAGMTDPMGRSCVNGKTHGIDDLAGRSMDTTQQHAFEPRYGAIHEDRDG